MKYLKRMVLILIIIIIILVITIIIKLYKNSNVNNDYNFSSNLEEDKDIDNVENQFQSITSYVDYFYVNDIGKSITEAIREINNNAKDGLIYFKNVVDSQDVITSKELIDFANSFASSGYTFYIDNVYSVYLDNNIMLFLVYAKIDNMELNYLVKLDYNNYTYSILLFDYIKSNNISIDSMKDDVNIFSNEITKNDANNVNLELKNESDFAKQYLYLIQCNFKYNLNKEYNILEEQYKTKKFTDYSNFVSYANIIQDDIQNVFLSKYQVEHGNDVTKYILLDSRGRYYTLYIKDYKLLDYSIRLDDYTILSDKYNEIYQSATNEQKVCADVEIFIKMINNKDYELAYNCLNDIFKNSYFGNEKNFENYIKKSFYDYNILNNSGLVNSDGKYYECSVKIIDNDNFRENMQEKTFIVALEDGTNFELSFNVE